MKLYMDKDGYLTLNKAGNIPAPDGLYKETGNNSYEFFITGKTYYEAIKFDHFQWKPFTQADLIHVLKYQPLNGISHYHYVMDIKDDIKRSKK